ncbi:hypothetical protein, partial [Enterobacter ludwigii]|uniref:hypothetical protein n=1 Tax=Enterobacter ludwigii TaxID=299767 RepID=UPI001CC30F33
SAPVAGYSACLTSFTSSIRFSLHAYVQSAPVNGLIPLFRRNLEGDKIVIIQSRDKQRRFFIIIHKSGAA